MSLDRLQHLQADDAELRPGGRTALDGMAQVDPSLGQIVQRHPQHPGIGRGLRADGVLDVQQEDAAAVVGGGRGQVERGQARPGAIVRCGDQEHARRRPADVVQPDRGHPIGVTRFGVGGGDRVVRGDPAPIGDLGQDRGTEDRGGLGRAGLPARPRLRVEGVAAGHQEPDQRQDQPVSDRLGAGGSQRQIRTLDRTDTVAVDRGGGPDRRTLPGGGGLGNGLGRTFADPVLREVAVLDADPIGDVPSGGRIGRGGLHSDHIALGAGRDLDVVPQLGDRSIQLKAGVDGLQDVTGDR